MPPLVLALDQSTSATKAVLFDPAGQQIAQAAVGHAQHYPAPGLVEQDAGEIWQNTLAAIREVIASAPDAADSITALAIANQRETFVVFDRRTGAPLHRAIVWLDRRGDPVCRRLRAEGAEPIVRSRTGLRLDSYFSAPKIAALLEERPDLAAKLRSGHAVLGTVDAYLIHRLTGGARFACDATNASRTLLFDIARRAWDPELCDLFGVPIRALPDPLECTAHFGDTDASGLLPRPVSIRGVMGDSQASLFAQRCFRPGDTKVTFGSGTSILLNTGAAFRPPGEGSVSALAWVCDGEPAYALEGIIQYSGATIAWLRDQIGLIADPAETAALAASVPDNGGTYLVPAFGGLGAPHWAPDARAALVGMTAFTTRAHIVRAALESIAFQIRDALAMLAAESGVRPSVLRADGGPTRNAFLMQCVADITRLPIEVSYLPGSSPLGAALAAFFASGTHAGIPALDALPRATTMFHPALAEDAAVQLLAGWRNALRQVLP